MDDTTLTFLVSGIRLPLGRDQRDALAYAKQILRLPETAILGAGIHKVSVDARHGTPVLVYTVAIRTKTFVPAVVRLAAHPEQSARDGMKVSLLKKAPLLLKKGTQPLAHPPVVCGLGPAGLFAAYLLAREGYCPIVLEQGPEVVSRMKAVQAFRHGGEFDEKANIQFGEGGAGTFSDGKLTTRIHDPLCGFVIDTLLAHGAPAEIAIQQKPHIGTDRLREVIVAVRNDIIAMGGSVQFETRLQNLQIKNNSVCAAITQNGPLPCEVLLLAPGHSARDTFAMLADNGVTLHCKPFSVGFRAEQLQSDINADLYHDAVGHPDLPAGEYQLSSHVGGRCVYTFCMCPGGQVVAASSEKATVVTNGMSYHARNGKNANAAVVVSVSEADFSGDAEKAIAFQRSLEQAAYTLGGGDYRAPAQDLKSFLDGSDKLHVGRVEPSYPRCVCGGDLGSLFGSELSSILRSGLRDFGRKLHSYTSMDTLLTGVETRTSSPVRLARGETMESMELGGLYPAGEGAGYAGGIVSAAVDGLRAARAVIERYAPLADDSPKSK